MARAQIEFIKIAKNLTANLGSNAVAVIAGDTVSCFRVTLPALSARKLRKTLPFLVSDLLVTDIEDMHLCLVETETPNDYLLLACAKTIMSEMQDKALAEELTLKAAWPDYMLIAPPSEGVAILHKDGDILCRRADGTGFRMPEKLAEAALSDVTKDARRDAKRGPPPEEGQGMATGIYGVQFPFMSYLPILKRPAILAATVLLIWVIGSFAQIGRHQAARADFEDASTQLFKQAFPDVTRVVNVEAQLMNKMMSSNALPARNFLYLTDTLFQAVEDVENIGIDRLNFDRKDTRPLQVTLRAQNFSALERVRQKLVDAGFAVSEGKSSQVENGVTGDFSLSSTAGIGQ
ncbi:MAG: type II secretion system protein GspL [Pseudomonadota bacterium]|nr:type II secretion system protein GspL [Pseudomonadota bacterium]MEC8475897.1 type II secretion system protein GspL [Pseudomonadota bacterium]MEC8535523.1 type II secretion system protein GspL [Pseudomonadota bacterium]